MMRLPNNTMKREGCFSYRFFLAALKGLLFGWPDTETDFLFLMQKKP